MAHAIVMSVSIIGLLFFLALLLLEIQREHANRL
jgi:hypothetical protein